MPQWVVDIASVGGVLLAVFLAWQGRDYLRPRISVSLGLLREGRAPRVDFYIVSMPNVKDGDIAPLLIGIENTSSKTANNVTVQLEYPSKHLVNTHSATLSARNAAMEFPDKLGDYVRELDRALEVRHSSSVGGRTTVRINLGTVRPGERLCIPEYLNLRDKTYDSKSTNLIEPDLTISRLIHTNESIWNFFQVLIFIYGDEIKPIRQEVDYIAIDSRLTQNEIDSAVQNYGLSQWLGQLPKPGRYYLSPVARFNMMFLGRKKAPAFSQYAKGMILRHERIVEEINRSKEAVTVSVGLNPLPVESREILVTVPVFYRRLRRGHKTTRSAALADFGIVRMPSNIIAFYRHLRRAVRNRDS